VEHFTTTTLTTSSNLVPLKKLCVSGYDLGDDLFSSMVDLFRYPIIDLSSENN
jgi:hypothetical protein